MLTRFITTGLLVLGLGLSAVSAQEGETKPKPDFRPSNIVMPEQGLVPGANKIRISIENRSKDSEVSGKVNFELVVLTLDGGRQSYLGEFEAMRFGQKREVTLEGIEIGSQEKVRFLVILDPENLVEETNEGNNRYLFQAQVKKPSAETPKPESSVVKP